MKPLQTLIMQLSRIPIAVLLVIIVVISGVIAITVTGVINEQIAMYKTKQIEIDRIANTKARVVYSIKDVQEGQLIQSDALEEHEIPLNKIPQDAIASASA